MDLVLEDGATDGDAESLAEGAEKRIHADGPGEMGGSGGGLDCESETGEEGALERESFSARFRGERHREFEE